VRLSLFLLLIFQLLQLLRVTLMVVLLGHYIPQGLPPLRLLEEMEKRLVVVQALVQVQAHSALVGQRAY
jgi:hypothetical protein